MNHNNGVQNLPARDKTIFLTQDNSQKNGKNFESHNFRNNLVKRAT